MQHVKLGIDTPRSPTHALVSPPPSPPPVNIPLRAVTSFTYYLDTIDEAMACASDMTLDEVMDMICIQVQETLASEEWQNSIKMNLYYISSWIL